MPREQVGSAHEFSEEATTTFIDVESNGNETVLFDADGSVSVDLDKGESPAPKEEVKSTSKVKDDIEIEIVDDTPDADKNRTASPPPEDPTEEELGEYSEKVQKRIKKFTKGYHDERRAKEAAQRELDEAVAYAQRLKQENEGLKQRTDKSQHALLEQAKRTVEGDLQAARREYREANDTGNSEKLLAAQEKLNLAQNRKERLSQIRLPPLQEGDDGVQRTPTEYSTPQPTPKADPKAVAWSEQNEWFGSDEDMTEYAYLYHKRLIRDGVDPSSDDYYEKLDSRMRRIFPENFDEIDGTDNAPLKDGRPLSKSEDVVAPATRSAAPKRIKLTQSQVRIAKRLGVPLEMYAKQVAEEQRKQSNG